MKRQVSPEQMTIICNIQMMQEKTGNKTPFNALSKMTYDELFEMQCTLISEYNAAIKH